jgi:glutathionyl-hydroquinone reductase
VTLALFDAVYHCHFKVNLRRLTDYPNLWDYARACRFSSRMSLQVLLTCGSAAF